MIRPMATAPAWITSEVDAPKMMRLRMSRPSSSVPSRWAADGGDSRWLLSPARGPVGARTEPDAQRHVDDHDRPGQDQSVPPAKPPRVESQPRVSDTGSRTVRDAVSRPGRRERHVALHHARRVAGALAAIIREHPREQCWLNRTPCDW